MRYRLLLFSVLKVILWVVIFVNLAYVALDLGPDHSAMFLLNAVGAASCMVCLYYINDTEIRISDAEEMGKW